MSQENVEIVRRTYEALNRGDMATWLNAFEPDAELCELPSLPDTRIYRGHDGLREWVESLRESWAEARFEPQDFTRSGDFVLVSVHAWARGLGSDVPTDMRVFHVFQMRAGKVTHVAGYLDRGEALKAVGLSE